MQGKKRDNKKGRGDSDKAREGNKRETKGKEEGEVQYHEEQKGKP